MFKNKILLITGGTGSFGNTVLSRFLKTDLSEIRIFSRDEQKQFYLQQKWKNKKKKRFDSSMIIIDSTGNLAMCLNLRYVNYRSSNG